jgi:hydrogenase maturation protein HypF
MTSACAVRVRGVVQGVGFRPFVYRLARANTLAGWVLNAGEGVEIHLEGAEERVNAFLRALETEAPAAAEIVAIDVESRAVTGLQDFTIRDSRKRDRLSARISPDLAVCERCLAELFDSADPRFGYPYTNCTNCGPRYSIILALPYDRPNTTMRNWPMDQRCAAEYHDPASRRFHAQPVACPRCGPVYRLARVSDGTPGTAPSSPSEEFPREGGNGRRAASVEAIACAVALLREGQIVAVKGLGGYHLACDALNSVAVLTLRERKFRKEKPFALMVPDLECARRLVSLSADAESLLTSAARPIVLAKAKVTLSGVAPENGDLGVMLPYTPLHHLLFAAGAPDVLVMTSANRSSEPIAYEDDDAFERLAGMADAFLLGERPIARRVEDSVARSGALGPVMLRRSRGYAPGAVATIPVERPVLALGADLKNAITLVVVGQAFVSQHIGDLADYAALRAFQETIEDLLSMYEVRRDQLLVAHDAHPQYQSTLYAAGFEGSERRAVQHHRAHIASVLAERGAWDKPVLGISLDGTGWGDDGTIWGGELFVGGVREGFERVAHVRQAALVGGDAAAYQPVQAAAGFLDQVDGLPELTLPPFEFPDRFANSLHLLRQGVRVFRTTSMGRLFDAAAALAGFTRAVTFEGQAAIWLEQQARGVPLEDPYPFPFDGRELDFRPLLRSVAQDRVGGRRIAEIARAFHAGVARGLADAAVRVCKANELDTVVISGGVFQNQLLLEDFASRLASERLEVWANRAVPPNDGGISLGQAALAGLGPATGQYSSSRSGDP